MKKVLILYIIWLVIINLFAYYSLNRFNLNPDTAYTWINPTEFYQDKNINTFVNLRVHWDSFWYLQITKEGYEYIPNHMSNIAFFPLYPSLIWVLSWVIPSRLAGWVISIIALGLGLFYLYRLVKEFHPKINPLEPITFLLIFPTAFFLNSVYTESLFLTLSIVFFYYLLKKNFLVAALFLSLASICRINGLFLFFPFIYEYFKNFGLRKLFNFNLLSFLIAPTGIASFMLYQYVKFGEPLAFLKSQMEWGRRFEFNPEHFQLFSPSSYANLSTDVLFFALAIVSGLLLLRIRVSYGLYVLVTAILAASTGTLMSIGRYALILFPIYILLASIKNRELKFGWQLISTLMLAVFTMLFVNDYWAG